MEPVSYNKYERAKKRVKKIRDFYNHIKIFVLITILVFVGRFYLLPKLGITFEAEEGFQNWLNWNTYIFPGIWAIVIGVQGLVVFKPKIFTRWEDRKIKELMEQEDEGTERWN